MLFSCHFSLCPLLLSILAVAIIAFLSDIDKDYYATISSLFLCLSFSVSSQYESEENEMKILTHSCFFRASWSAIPPKEKRNNCFKNISKSVKRGTRKKTTIIKYFAFENNTISTYNVVVPINKDTVNSFLS